MKKKNILYAMLTILVLTVVTLSCSKNYSSPNNGNPTSTTISIKSSGYSVANLQVTKGSTVMWRNDDMGVHTVTADNGNFDSGDIMAGGTYSYSFSSVGTFTYHDKHNAMITGMITVVNAPSGGGY